MSRAIIRAAGVAAIVAGLVLIFEGPAAAHEERNVGRYHFAVGFGDEPAYAGQKNSVQLLLSDATGKPVVDLGSKLQVQVAYGSLKMPALAVEPNFEIGESGTPGDYRGWFIPTRPGRYSFHFTGSIKGHRINEKFTSGPTTFSNVEDPQGVEFPAKDPTSGQLNELLGRETARLRKEIASTQSDASGDASMARNLSVLALAVGVIALAYAIATRNRSK